MARIVENGCPLCKKDVSKFSLHCEEANHPFEIAVSLVLNIIPNVDDLLGDSKRPILALIAQKHESCEDYIREMARFVQLSSILTNKISTEQLHSKESDLASEKYFPCICTNCNACYLSAHEALDNTQEIKGRTPLLSPEAGVVVLERICSCGASVSFKIKQRRQVCEDGLARRLTFENLQQRLVAIGVPIHETRHTILVTAHRASKVMRNDLF
jgi:hypothetical protein